MGSGLEKGSGCRVSCPCTAVSSSSGPVNVFDFVYKYTHRLHSGSFLGITL